tara:strand:+ start:3297 stop:3683 length:387 start_codon:yes stop_codon:yes gene_type:complete
MYVKIKISIGELVDKITILQIKKEMIVDDSKLKKVENELNHLQSTLATISQKNAKLDELMTQLKEINTKLWKIEDDIRLLEKEERFDNEFIELARSVYITNDKRFEIKNAINLEFSSEIAEVKSYEKY